MREAKVNLKGQKKEEEEKEMMMMLWKFQLSLYQLLEGKMFNSQASEASVQRVYSWKQSHDLYFSLSAPKRKINEASSLLIS